MNSVCSGFACPIDLTGLMDAAAQLFNDLFPIFIIIVGFGFGIGILRLMAHQLRYGLDLPSNRAVVVQKTKMISLDEITEKPKRGLVTLGDDGELTSVPEESELENYHIIR